MGTFDRVILPVASVLILSCSAATQITTRGASVEAQTTATAPKETQTSTAAHNSSTVEDIAQSFDLPSNLTLRKCLCQGHQELHGSECRDQETYTGVVDFEKMQRVDFKSSDFPSVTVGDIECPQGYSKVLLNYVDQTFILTTGELIWFNQQQVIQNYCLEHVPGGWEARVCLEVPEVPRCCPPGYAMGPDDSCVLHSSSQTFAPPIMLNNEVMERTDVTGDVTNITCSGISVSRRVSLDNGGGNLLYNRGSAVLTYETPSYVPVMEPEENYCVGVSASEEGEPQYIAKFCYTDPKEEHYHTCKNATCVRKCCLARQFLLYDGCADFKDNEEDWQPVYHERSSLQPGADAPENLVFVYGIPFCELSYELKPHLIELDKSYLLRDGSLHLRAKGDFPPDSYCIDKILEADGTMRDFAVICASESCAWKPTLDVVLLSLSCVFLVATLAVYLGVPELRDRTNGRCLISLVVAILATFITFLVNNRKEFYSDVQCVITGFFGHFFGLAMFFWLNVMCYDMWHTLRSSAQQHQSKKTFIKYSVYAWGVPLLVAIIARIIDHLQPENFILPNFVADKVCWFRDNAEYWLYWSGIIASLLVVNLFFFIHVAITLSRKLRQRRATFNNINSQASNNKTKAQAWLYIKLFIVMGICWIAESTSNIRHRNTCSFWVVMDILNGLQGVFIFLVSVCNKDNLKKFRSAWHPRVQSVRSKISTMRGRSPIRTNRRKTDVSLATSETSRKTSVTSLPRKISTASVPFQNSNMAANKEKRNTGHSISSQGSGNSRLSPPPRKISTASNLETIPMNTLEE